MKIKFTVDRLENDLAVLLTEEGEAINWPKKLLPENARESMILVFNIDYNNEAEKKDKQLAKDILNEILDTNP